MNSNPEIYFAPHDCSVLVFVGSGDVLGVITWNAETQARFTPEEAVLRAAELNAAAGWSEPCVVNGVEIDVAGVVPHAASLPENSESALGEAMQDVWNDHCIDAGTIPSCFSIHGPRTSRVSAAFAGSKFVGNVVMRLRSLGFDVVPQGGPVSLFEAAGRPPGTISQIHQYDAAACCRHIDTLERERDHYREARDELKHELSVMRAASRAWHKCYIEASEQRDRLAESLRPFAKMMGGYTYLGYEYVKAASDALAAVEGGDK